MVVVWMYQRSQSCVKGEKITRSIYKWMIYQYISWKTLKKHQHTMGAVFVYMAGTWVSTCPTCYPNHQLQRPPPAIISVHPLHRRWQPTPTTHQHVYFCFLLYSETFLYTIQVFFFFFPQKNKKKSFHVFFSFCKE